MNDQSHNPQPADEQPPPTEPAETADADVNDRPEQTTDEPTEEHPPARREPVDEAEAAAIVEAILFASDTPLGQAKIATVAELTTGQIRKAIETLNARYDQDGSAFSIEAIAGGYQMLTRPAYHDVLSRLLRTKKDNKLSQAAMETLAIIAYRQPILRADIEAIRGVACGEVLRGLLDRQMVKIVGRAEVLGRPMLYGTTRQFLEVFGLASLDDLPRADELKGGADDRPEETRTAGDEQSEDENGDDYGPGDIEEDVEDNDYLEDEYDEEENFDDDEEFEEEDFDEEDEDEFDDDEEMP